MVFSSLQAFLDPTSNWHHPQQDCGEVGEISQLGLPPSPVIGVGGGSETIRPTSMTERARLAKIPQPETALKCPRCESTNTKFCYFNNYSLSQPRHFCKTCRRYWTRGGALRNVPVGGGCRRNKRSKCNRSKSPATRNAQDSEGSGSAIVDILGNLNPSPSLPFLPSLHHFGDYTDLGMGCGVLLPPPPPPISATHAAELQFEGESSSAGGMLTGGWRMQQVNHPIPLISGVDYSIDGGAMDPSSYVGAVTAQYRSKSFLDPILAQMGAVKMEDGQGPRNFLSMYGSDHQYNSVSNPWSDVSGFVSSSTATHIV